jgi:nitrile hydratase accessory protein
LSACELPSAEFDRLLGPDRPQAFAAPWEAQAFAMALMLHERGVFTWGEWAEALGAEVSRARRIGEADDGRSYYHHWLRALEALVVRKGVASAGLLTVMRERWDEAARATAHGEPVLLAG